MIRTNHYMLFAEAYLGLLQHPRWSALWKPLSIITKRSILDVAAVLDPPLIHVHTPEAVAWWYS